MRAKPDMKPWVNIKQKKLRAPLGAALLSEHWSYVSEVPPLKCASMIKGLWQNYFLPQPPFRIKLPEIGYASPYSSTSLFAGYPASLYALFAPLGTISLRLPGVSSNILE